MQRAACGFGFGDHHLSGKRSLKYSPKLVRSPQKKKVIIFPTSEKLPLNDKNLYLSSVACDQNFKRFFDNYPLQYCRSSLVISESSRGREFDTPDMLYTFLTTASQIDRKKIE